MGDPSIAEKRCPRCETVKAITEFHRRYRKHGDGYQGWCKPCMMENGHAARTRWRLSAEGRMAIYAAQKRYARARPERIKARSAVSSAIRRGRLERLPCEKCGDPNSQAHHDDYSKPLDVRWLCQPHHTKEHMK